MGNPFCRSKIYICKTLSLGSFYWHIGSGGRVAKIEPANDCGNLQRASESTFRNQLENQRMNYVGLLFDIKNAPMKIIWDYTECRTRDCSCQCGCQENNMETYIVKTFNSGTHLVRVQDDIIMSVERMSDDSIKKCTSFYWVPLDVGKKFSEQTRRGSWRGDTWVITKCDPCCPPPCPPPSCPEPKKSDRLSVTISGNVDNVNRAMKAIMNLDGGNIVDQYEQDGKKATATINYRSMI